MKVLWCNKILSLGKMFEIKVGLLYLTAVIFDNIISGRPGRPQSEILHKNKRITCLKVEIL